MLNENPQAGYIKPGRIFGNLYFVGTRPASTHIIDTGDGFILIDPGYQDSLYMVIQNMWEMGLNPKNVKYILLSHGHFDHSDAAKALAEMTGAKIIVSKEDLPLVTGEICHYHIIPCTPDILLEDGDTVKLGNTIVKCVLTPGHTDGTMSFFFDVTDGKTVYRAGMFGGAGINTLEKEFLVKNGLPFENRDKYFASLEKIENEKVDIFIGNHVGNNNTEEKLKEAETADENPFIKPDEWKEFLESCRISLENLIKSEK